MNKKQGPDKSARDVRKAYRALRLVKHGHFLDVVREQPTPEGSQIVDL